MRATTAQPFPMRFDTKLTYGVNVTLTTAGSLSTGVLQRFRLNSCYDPDVTNTGHQPYQYDQLTSIYLNYVVKCAYVDLTFSDPTNDGVWVGWSWHTSSVSNDDPSSLQLQDYMERPNFVCAPLNNTGAQTVTLRQRIPIPEALGLMGAEYFGDLSTYGAPYNGNPSIVAYLDTFLVDPTANVSTRSVRCTGRIVYDVQFYNYAAPGSS